ncbi:GGDEF domain-containing protein [Streptacidiphilus monticola]|uniref:GGDEF domain-containing protein n=1 Tax=Streptacidiphilus monticola TaxID=2161674 RepID=A0ABW1G0H0_9ACTN
MLHGIEDALALLCVPALLLAAGCCYLLARGRRRSGRQLRALRQQVARLESARAELERTSCTDALTGVWNYRYLQLALDREVARHDRRVRTQLPGVAVLLLEVDGFAALRREYGHQRAGSVLRDLALRLAMEVRAEDVFGRYGGEEFLVVLPDTDRAGAEAVAERLSWTVRRHPLALPAVPAGEGTGPAKDNGLRARVGIAVMPGDGSHSALLLKAVDSSLAERSHLRDSEGPVKSSA